jgi:hypothetical protein
MKENPVEFGELGIVLVERAGDLALEPLGDAAAQEVAAVLDVFVARLGHWRTLNDKKAKARGSAPDLAS